MDYRRSEIPKRDLECRRRCAARASGRASVRRSSIEEGENDEQLAELASLKRSFSQLPASDNGNEEIPPPRPGALVQQDGPAKRSLNVRSVRASEQLAARRCSSARVSWLIVISAEPPGALNASHCGCQCVCSGRGKSRFH
ncbi:hypothetical protein HN011_000017 [Eciton burchellii]|nr:hypothetical protein HN011_000017 [Eciton burchellii]